MTFFRSGFIVGLKEWWKLEQIHRYNEDYVYKDRITFIGDIQKNERNLLTIPLRNEGNKKILVIMKNPSKANKEISDRTINNVIKFCFNNGYCKVNIMNLFSYYSTDPNGITKLIDQGKYVDAVGKQNDQILINTSIHIDDVIVAWGGNSINRERYYKKRISEVLEIIKNKNIYYVESISKNGLYPKHAQVWSVNQDIEMYEFKMPIFK